MKENLAKLYAGVNTIIYVNDARKYKYNGNDGSSSECTVNILDVENVAKKLLVVDLLYDEVVLIPLAILSRIEDLAGLLGNLHHLKELLRGDHHRLLAQDILSL